jgi:16S rRNA (uracil1498-N3)-methyltransferase
MIIKGNKINKMECIYSSDLEKNTNIVEISGDEARHLRALRSRLGDGIEISNGRGLLSIAEILSESNRVYKCKIMEVHNNKGELPATLDIAFGIISDRNRLEFLIEKGTETGICNFFPVVTEFTQKGSVNIDRLRAKAMAAMKQCKRAILPHIHRVMNFDEIIGRLNNYQNIILSDIHGTGISDTSIHGSTLLMIGPEGGFSDNELHRVSEYDPLVLSLGTRRLRTETAAIITAGIVSTLIK